MKSEGPCGDSLRCSENKQYPVFWAERITSAKAMAGCTLESLRLAPGLSVLVQLSILVFFAILYILSHQQMNSNPGHHSVKLSKFYTTRYKVETGKPTFKERSGDQLDLGIVVWISNGSPELIYLIVWSPERGTF